MDFHAIVNHPFFLNPFMAAITAMGLTSLIMALVLSATAGVNVGRRY